MPTAKASPSFVAPSTVGSLTYNSSFCLGSRQHATSVHILLSRPRFLIPSTFPRKIDAYFAVKHTKLPGIFRDTKYRMKFNARIRVSGFGKTSASISVGQTFACTSTGEDLVEVGLGSLAGAQRSGTLTTPSKIPAPYVWITIG